MKHYQEKFGGSICYGEVHLDKIYPIQSSFSRIGYERIKKYLKKERRIILIKDKYSESYFLIDGHAMGFVFYEKGEDKIKSFFLETDSIDSIFELAHMNNGRKIQDLVMV
ncbi:MAG: hypothetical protein KAU20_06910 [Nanoarchaeota archaeon]|nr:hypothetical protein [Nanoarchaeota archaeon]